MLITNSFGTFDKIATNIIPIKTPHQIVFISSNTELDKIVNHSIFEKFSEYFQNQIYRMEDTRADPHKK